LALLSAAGCAGKQWQVLPASPDTLGAWADVVRLTLNDGTRLVVTSPQVRNDSVVGRGQGGSVAIPLSQVSRVAVEAPNPDKPAATRVALVAAGITLLSLFALVLLVN
jgi:hypothetical protein